MKDANNYLNFIYLYILSGLVKYLYIVIIIDSYGNKYQNTIFNKGIYFCVDGKNFIQFTEDDVKDIKFIKNKHPVITLK